MMFRLNELRRPAMTIAIDGGDGQRVEISATRHREGQVALTCTCAGAAAIGWCRHLLNAACDELSVENETDRQDFSDIVLTTPIHDAGEELREALEIFAEAYREMKESLPSNLDNDKLEEFGHNALDAGRAACDLAVAIDKFRKKLERGRKDAVPKV